MTVPEDHSFLEVRGVYKAFAEGAVLNGIDFVLGQGQVFALLGPSGSGKSTLLRIIGGFEQADAGEIRVGGRDVQSLPPERRNFGFVFQSYALFPHLRVGQNVAFGLRAARRDRAESRERVETMLQLVSLQGFADRRVTEISGGQQQRVALARSLAPEPRLLLLDEPLSNLDPTLRDQTRAELRRTIRRVGLTTVLVTHEQEEAFELGDIVGVLGDGRLQQMATADELYRRPANRFVAEFVGRSSTVPAVVESVTESAVAVRLRGLSGAPRSWMATIGDDASRQGLAAGVEVDFWVRPESLRLASDGVRGQVREVSFTGALTYARIVLGEALSGGPEVEVATRELLTVGDSVALVLDDRQTPARIFPRSKSSDRGDDSRSLETSS